MRFRARLRRPGMTNGDWCQMACKPGSVPPQVFQPEEVMAIHLGRLLPDASCDTPGPRDENIASCSPYSVLLPVGFTVPCLLPNTRCALTAPFHPYLASEAVCFLWHFPWGRPRRALPGTVFPWSPDFPHACRSTRAAIRPSGTRAECAPSEAQVQGSRSALKHAQYTPALGD